MNPVSRTAARPESARPELRRAAVIGAGIAGLVVARDLQRAGVPTTLVEAQPRVGGMVRAETLAEGIRVDVGAEGFAVRGDAVVELAAQLGLAERLCDPRTSRLWLPPASGAHPLPEQSLHGIPAVPLAREVIDVLGWGGALRAQLDRLMPVGNPQTSRSPTWCAVGWARACWSGSCGPPSWGCARSNPNSWPPRSPRRACSRR